MASAVMGLPPVDVTDAVTIFVEVDANEEPRLIHSGDDTLRDGIHNDVGEKSTLQLGRGVISAFG